MTSIYVNGVSIMTVGPHMESEKTFIEAVAPLFKGDAKIAKKAFDEIKKQSAKKSNK